MNRFEVIAKFGGTSVAIPHDIKQHVRHDMPGIMVVSAPDLDLERGYDRKVTDMYLDIEEGASDVEPVIVRLEVMTADMALSSDDASRQSIRNMGQHVKDWQEKDWPVETLGEFYAAQMYASFLGKQFVDAANIIRFDLNGHLDLEESEQLIQDRFSPDVQYVVPGFYGADHNGDIRVFVW